MYFKEGIKAVIKTKFFSLIIVIQLVIAFLSLIAGVTLVYGAFAQVHKFERVFNPNTTLYITYAAVSMNDSIDENDEKNLVQYYTKLINDKNINKIGTSYQQSIKSDGLLELNAISDGKEAGLSNLISIDENFYKYIDNIKLSEGRKFAEADFRKKEKGIIPIIISKDLEKYMSLGKVYHDKYEVIGVLEENNDLFYYYSHVLYEEVTQKKYTIIMPVNYRDEANIGDISNSFKNNTMITLKDKSLCNEYIQKLNNDLSKICPIPLKVSKASDYKAYYIKLHEMGIIATMGLSAILIIFSFFGIMGIILSSIIRRKKEFGVKLSFGWSIRDISLQVVSEILVLSMSAFIISSLLSLVVVRGEDIELSLYTYVISLVLVLIFTSLYALIPINKIRKMNIVELIKDVK